MSFNLIPGQLYYYTPQYVFRKAKHNVARVNVVTEAPMDKPSVIPKGWVSTGMMDTLKAMHRLGSKSYSNYKLTTQIDIDFAEYPECKLPVIYVSAAWDEHVHGTTDMHVFLFGEKLISLQVDKNDDRVDFGSLNISGVCYA